MNESLSWSAIIAFFIFIGQQIFKTWLDYRKYRSEVVFSKLHQERAETIKELYKKMVLLECSIKIYLYPELAKDVESESKESFSQEYYFEKMNEAFRDTIDYFILNKLCLSDKLCQRIESLLEEYIDMGQNYYDKLEDIRESGLGLWTKRRFKEKDKMREIYPQKMSELLKDLTIEFKKTLGTK